MAKTDTFQLSVVTPEKIALEREARFVAVPAHDGEMGILCNRAPLLVRLTAGTLRIEGEGEKSALYIDGGFAQMVDNRLTILTEDARTAEEIDSEAAEASLKDAQETRAVGDEEIDARDKSVQRARAQLRLVGGGSS